MNKFNRYDRVKVMRGKYKDKIALITEAEEHEDDDGCDYIVTGVDEHFYLRIDEDFLESAPTVTGENIFLDYLNESTHNEEPRFRVGDVVNVVDDVLHLRKDGIVEEVVAVDDGKTRHYEYHIADYDRPLSGWDVYEEPAVRFKYHDTKWEEYYTEMMNGYRERMKQKELTEHVEPEPKPIPRSFKVGNKIKATSKYVHGVGVIVEVAGSGEWAGYTVMLEGENRPRVFYGKNLELIADSVFTERTEDGVPVFKSGDVVYVVGSPNKTNVAIMEVAGRDETSGEYMYEVALLYNGSIRQYSESELGYLYHDSRHERNNIDQAEGIWP